MCEALSIRTQYSTSPTLVEPATSRFDSSSPDAIVRDLQQRVVDWAGVSPSNFGALRIHDTLTIRKGIQEKQFGVYLFEEAIICIGEQRRRRMFGSLPVFGSKPAPSLCLKGRIFIRHINRIRDTSMNDEQILTIETSAGNIETFTIAFTDECSLKKWYSELSAVLSSSRPGMMSFK